MYFSLLLRTPRSPFRVPPLPHSAPFSSNVTRSQSSVYTSDGYSTTALVSMTQTSTDELKTWQTSYRDQSTPATTATVRTTPDGSGAYTVTVTYPDNSTQVSAYSYGRLTSVTRKNSSGGQVSQTTYAYDTHGRVYSMTDARNGATVYGYNNGDQVTTLTTPSAGGGEAPQVTTTFYDALARITGYLHPDGTSSTNLYYVTGLLEKTSGSRTYPVEYSYDDQGRMRTMKTWQDLKENSGTATTTWSYDAYRGWLKSKDYPNAGDGTAGTLGPDYTYTGGGRLKTRTWARPQAGPRIVTTYYYGFDDDGLPGGSSVDQHGDLARVIYSNDPASTPETRYAYDRRGRQRQVIRNGITTEWTYNDANQPLTETHTGGTLGGLSMRSVYQYDGLGQVVSGCRFWQDGTPVAGQQSEYRFDDIGNRGTSSGRASAVSDYTANRLNQYTTRTVPPYVDVTGIANPTAGVTVNGNTANRKGEYFHWPLNVPNSTAQYPTVQVISQYGAGQIESGKVYVPAASEAFSHDDDGNLTADGRWAYTWDAENRLIEMRRDSDSPAGARQRLVFEYDHQGRRIRKQFYTYSGGWQLQMDTICLYDGWNVVCEFNGSKTPLRTYVWGTDLSGSLTGAGGVGGLLWVNNQQTTYDGKTVPTGVHFVAYDGNGNVAALVNAAYGTTQARYEYSPFAEPVRATGDLADANPFRFSTKWTDNESGLLYYGYRYYNPTTGRSLNRDPIGEQPDHIQNSIEPRQQINLYLFVQNRPISHIDTDGRKDWPLP